ncbi:hypothetical protein A3H26_03265 [candidate division WWE3 bacterium RIFCSPLOWO2_12_FULL_36_10]|uniref:Polysaccharide biosynthesis protein C-terminal domain-containing protein n=1 Tax=candidate division WWE3 bacterium RIFCSPLOWO2_12_FULL_36_10 TaxID=1802630 RepID=A0A1F4VK97_UNCKA|nr:MAG: hypothetical protein A3H26_03265 [candidate division WWE3 bacterium RIFCSPLOWO2_12_FULL_36_10]
MDKVKKLLSNVEISGTIVVTAGLLIGAILSYALQYVMGNGKLITLSEYGLFTALLSLSNILTIPYIAFGKSIVMLTSELKAEEKFDILTNLFWKFNLILFFIGILVFILLVFLRSYISVFLNISNSNMIIYFASFIALSLAGLLPAAYLQGLLRFKAFSFFTILSAALRLLFPVILVFLGFGIGGAYLGMGISAVVSFIASLFLLKKNFVAYKKQDLRSYYSKFYSIGFASLLISAGLILLNNLDVVLVKHYFSEVDTGIYSALVTVGKVLLFGTATVGIVMFPIISGLYTKGEDYSKKFNTLFIIQIVLVVFGTAFFYFFPSFITNLLFKNFTASIIYLPRFSIFMGLYVLVEFMILFLLAINKLKVYILLICATFIQSFLIVLFHRNIFQIINVNIIVSLVLFLLILLYHFIYIRPACAGRPAYYRK